MESAGADLDVVRLQQQAALLVPVVLQAQDDFLERRPVGDFRRGAGVEGWGWLHERFRNATKAAILSCFAA